MAETVAELVRHPAQNDGVAAGVRHGKGVHHPPQPPHAPPPVQPRPQLACHLRKNVKNNIEYYSSNLFVLFDCARIEPACRIIQSQKLSFKNTRQ